MSYNPSKKQAKRHLASAHVHLENAALHLAATYALFDNVHPDMAKNLQDITMYVLQAELLIERFWEEAWIHVPDDFQKAAK